MNGFNMEECGLYLTSEPSPETGDTKEGSSQKEIYYGLYINLYSKN